MSEQLERFLKIEASTIDLTSPTTEKGYWGRAKLKDVTVGDDNRDRIFHAVGMALTQWETLENEMFRLYLIFCESNNSTTITALRRAFGTIESSDARRKALEEVARIYFGDDNYPDGKAKPFKLLFESHKKASDRRNEIAHGIANGFMIDNSFKGWFLFPAAYNSGCNSDSYNSSFGEDGGPFMTEHYRYTSREIYEFSQKFSVLTDFTVACLRAAGKVEGTLKIELMHLI